jgi:mRNA-degrading endonuclease RelE of RelBE toxin-antitoxin system
VTSGEYRIVYRIESGAIEVIVIGKRDGDDVYRQMRRMGL